MRLQFDPEVDYYEVLQVHPKAHPEIIKRAYRALVSELHAHPDLGGSHQQMVLINRAHEVLSNPELRQAYDRWRESQAADRLAARPAAPSAVRPVPPTSPRAGSPAAVHAITAVCVKCGRRNRIPQDIGLTRARCGNCGERLIFAAAPRPSMTPSGPRLVGAPSAERARAAPGAAKRRLPQELYNELVRDGQLHVRLDRVARGSRVVCRKCQVPWWAPATGRTPRRCPACGSDDWLTFCLLRCSHCGHEFETNRLRAWPYLLYPACPSCGARNWNRAAERSPLRWVMRLLAGRAPRQD
jgi:curved DNA-binding protein CbpA